jgi:uncharacterized protein (TIGR00255 family)
MSVYSMTGYATATSGATNDTKTASKSSVDALQTGEAISPKASPAVTIELRSVNGRFLDLSFRLPDELRALEPALRELLASSFKRGKIELRLNMKAESDTAWPQPQPDQLNRLSRLEAHVQAWLPKAQGLSVHEVMQWCKGGSTAEKFDDAALQAMRAAVKGLLDARAREGKRLVAVLMERVTRLRELTAMAEPLVPAVVQRQQQKFLERWEEALAAVGAAQTVSKQTLQERAVNEAAAYAIRIDVAEELARLRAHLDEVARLLKAGGEVGKRLDFLIQELLREANTMGSKASSLELTNISVEMKVAIEQLREQVQNIE